MVSRKFHAFREGPLVWLLAIVGAGVFGFLLLPIIVRIGVGRPLPAAALDVRGMVVPWFGLLGIALRLRDGGLQVGPALAGRAPGPWWTKGSGDGEPTASAEAAKPRTGGSAGQAAQPAAGTAPAADADAAGDAPAEGWLARRRRQTARLHPLMRPLIHMVRTYPSAFALQRLRVEGTVGLADPAATGQLCGLLHAAGALEPRRVRLRVDTDFVTPGVCGRVDLSVRFYLARMLWILARFAAVGGCRWLWYRWRRPTRTADTKRD